MVTLIGWIISAVAIYATAWLLLSDKQKSQIANLLSSLILAGLHGATKLLSDAEPYLDPIIDAFEAAFIKYGPGFQAKLTGPIGDLAKSQFTNTEALLKTVGYSTPDNAVDTAAEALRISYGFGISSAAVTAAFESVFPEKLNVLNGAGAMLAQMAGFSEVTNAIRDPLYHNAFGKAAEYHYRSIFRPELPDESDAVLWHGRGLLTDDQLKDIFKYSGLKLEYENAFIQSGYRAVQPRALATAIQDTPFPTDEMRSLLKFNGYRPADIELMLQAFEGASTRNVRNQYLSAVTTAAERGTLTAAEVDSALTDLNFSDTAKHWVQLTIATRKLEQLAELYRKSISEDYRFGLITDAQYVPALEAIGIAQADADAHYAVDSAAKHGRELAAAAREAAREAAAITRAASKAALLNYQEGNVDAVALAAALGVAGVPIAIIPFAVDVAVLRKQAGMRSVFGKQVDQKDAVLLREQVAAIKEQVIKKLLDLDPAYNQLVALGIPATNAQDLVSAWAAQALKTVVPVL
jgi:hypothetical protein